MIRAIKAFIGIVFFVALIAASLGVILLFLPVEFVKNLEKNLGI